MSKVKLKNGEDYKNSLKELNPEIYVMGEKVNDVTTHPLIKPHVESAALTYQLARGELMLTESHLLKESVNRFTHIHQSKDDLIKKVKMLRMIGQKTGSCFQRCVGLDALNALYITTHDIDRKRDDTEYHERFLEYLKYVQQNDLMIAGAMTDPKGERNKAPHKQHDPDLYLRVVEERDDGIIICGAKMHMTGMANSHEMLVMPTRTLKKEDKDYAVSFALPVDAEGVFHIFGRQTNDLRKMEEEKWDQGNFKYGMVGGETLTVFEDVFVPKSRVFMCGEYDFSGQLVEMFSSYHRQNYGACKVGIIDIIIGAVSEIARQNGVATASHIKDKVAEMVRLAETLYSGSIACSAEGKCTSCGTYYVNPILANTVKLNVTEHIYEVCRLAHDITGGIIATLPSQKDYDDEKLGNYVKKYIMADPETEAEFRFKILRLVENLTGGTALVESMHGAGSPQAQRLMLLRQANLPGKITLAKNLVSEK
ncbi:MAG: 4-hydroxyphenylacetate 3-hydroxylase family protein [Halanaerobiales bacterium]